MSKRTMGVAIVALAAGPFQFMAALRLRRRGLHRALGFAYLGGVLVGSATGLVMATIAEGGLSSRVGFVVMAVLWFVTGLKAWSTARQRDFAAHRRCATAT